jgi:predicted metalloprotease
MKFMPEIKTKNGSIIWVEKTGDLQLRMCVAYESPQGLLLTVEEGSELIAQIRKKQAEIRVFK